MTIPEIKVADNDAPDLARSPWREKLDAAQVRIGRPKSPLTKVSMTNRTDQEKKS